MSDLPLAVCRICGDKSPSTLTARGLSGHIGAAHKPMNKASYINLFPDSEADFDDTRNARGAQTQFEAVGESAPTVTGPEPASYIDTLNPAERKVFDDLFEETFQQVDRDPVQIPTVESLAWETVMLKRLRMRQAKTKNNDRSLSEDIESTSKRLQNLMTALGISRAEKLKNKTVIKSSVAALISGYLDEIERNPTEVLQTMLQEERQALRSTEPRTKQYILDVAPTLKQDVDDPDNDYIPNIDEIARRANIQL